MTTGAVKIQSSWDFTGDFTIPGAKSSKYGKMFGKAGLLRLQQQVVHTQCWNGYTALYVFGQIGGAKGEGIHPGWELNYNS